MSSSLLLPPPPLTVGGASPMCGHRCPFDVPTYALCPLQILRFMGSDSTAVADSGRPPEPRATLPAIRVIHRHGLLVQVYRKQQRPRPFVGGGNTFPCLPPGADEPPAAVVAAFPRRENSNNAADPGPSIDVGIDPGGSAGGGAKWRQWPRESRVSTGPGELTSMSGTSFAAASARKETGCEARRAANARETNSDASNAIQSECQECEEQERHKTEGAEERKKPKC
ncbi:hypothetical protein K438DRAFT_1771382 [Mycena galopus ATCC 62051]|nr:hypothetical protein K438DRAFT_1771382 [Mycena galopus ATCC 62051]